MRDEVTLVTRKAVTAGEELTIDYAMFTLGATWIGPFQCGCGASVCRGVITGRDWEWADLQASYAGLLHPLLAARIAQESSAHRTGGDTAARKFMRGPLGVPSSRKPSGTV